MNTLSKTDFENEVLTRLQEKVINNYVISLKTVSKNNGLELNGLSIEKENTCAAPIIYLNSFYNQYQTNEKTLEEIVEYIYDSIDGYFNNAIEASVASLESYNPNALFVKLVNKEKNIQALENAIWKPFLDLAVTVRVGVDFSSVGLASSAVTKDMARHWRIDENQILEEAITNTQKLFPAKITSLAHLLLDSMPDCTDLDDSGIPLYVATNPMKINGAATILTSNCVREFAKKFEDNVYILPSSIHECLLIPSQNAPALKDLQTMVQEANNTVVQADEILSYNVYLYDLETDSFSCTQKEE